jgi:hypothetical protein
MMSLLSTAPPPRQLRPISSPRHEFPPNLTTAIRQLPGLLEETVAGEIVRHANLTALPLKLHIMNGALITAHALLSQRFADSY